MLTVNSYKARGVTRYSCGVGSPRGQRRRGGHGDSRSRAPCPPVIYRVSATWIGSVYLKALDFIVVVLYLALMSVIGIYFSKRQTSGETYFLAGRGVSGILAGISILATLLSTISYLSIPGEMIRFGIGYFSSYLALILVVPVVSKVIIPYLMRLPVTSIYEYLEKRYGVQIRTLAAAIFIFTERLDLVQQGDFRV